MKEEMGRACSSYGETNAYKFSILKPERKRQLGRPSHNGKKIL
jgi:hypothetical protein